MNNKILHIAVCDKFIPPFVNLVKKHLEFEKHEFYLTDGMSKQQLIFTQNVFINDGSFFESFYHYLHVIVKMHKSRKVILHGLFDIKIICILFFMPWLLKKCHWIIWGGDLYVYKFGEKNIKWKLRELLRRPVIKNVGNFITYIKGDYELVKKWYDAKGRFQQCLIYPSNLYNDFNVPEKGSNTINILVGNSADPSNNHLDTLNKLKPFKEKDIKIYIPLTYGNTEYAEMITEYANLFFNNKVEIISKHMPLNEYIMLLSNIDIAIFNHERQQAMGNTITLLGLGKKVYMRKDVTQWGFFKNIGVEVYDISDFSLDIKINEKIENNKTKIKDYFSEDALVKQLCEIFD